VNYQLDIKNFLNTLEPEAKEATYSSLVLRYYEYKGITEDTTVKQWLCGLAVSDYPDLTVAHKTIKKLLKKDYNENKSKT